MKYDLGMACLNGHTINGFARTRPEHDVKFCGRCGQSTICECPRCKTEIRGELLDDGAEFTHPEHWEPPAYCHECGAPYPWTERKKEALAEAIDELDELDEAERNRLKESIPDVIQETPKTEAAVARYKKAIAKCGEVGKKLLIDTLSNVAVEVIRKSIGI